MDDNFNFDPKKTNPTPQTTTTSFHSQKSFHPFFFLHSVLFFVFVFVLRKVDAVDISVPEVFLGGIAGATLVFYFSGQCMTAVGLLEQQIWGAGAGNLWLKSSIPLRIQICPKNPGFPQSYSGDGMLRPSILL